MDKKIYKISGVDFTMAEIMLGHIEKVQELLKIDLVDFVKNSVNTPVIALKIELYKYSTKICSIVLSPMRPITFFENIPKNDKASICAIREVVTDFFVLHNPVEYYLENLTALMTLSSASPTETSQKEN